MSDLLVVRTQVKYRSVAFCTHLQLLFVPPRCLTLNLEKSSDFKVTQVRYLFVAVVCAAVSLECPLALDWAPEEVYTIVTETTSLRSRRAAHYRITGKFYRIKSYDR
ncbi:hypothetical protein BaRGS_00025078, partial [Batillaria attramentaria]